MVSDTPCSIVVQDSMRAKRGLARMLMIHTGYMTRFLTVGVDSTNRPRLFSILVSHGDRHTVTTRMVMAWYGEDGRMSRATRTLTTQDVPSGTGDSKSVRLSDADTGRVRELTAEVLRRCLH